MDALQLKVSLLMKQITKLTKISSFIVTITLDNLNN
jgi:hypothetical protein